MKKRWLNLNNKRIIDNAKCSAKSSKAQKCNRLMHEDEILSGNSKVHSTPIQSLENPTSLTDISILSETENQKPQLSEAQAFIVEYSLPTLSLASSTLHPALQYTLHTISNLQSIYKRLIKNCILHYHSTGNIYFYLHPEAEYQRALLEPDCPEVNHEFIKRLFLAVYTHPLIIEKAAAIVPFQKLWIDGVLTTEEHKIFNLEYKESAKNSEQGKSSQEAEKQEQKEKALINLKEFIMKKAIHSLNYMSRHQRFIIPDSPTELSKEILTQLSQNIWIIQYMLREVKKHIDINRTMLHITETYIRYSDLCDEDCYFTEMNLSYHTDIHNKICSSLLKIEQDGIYRVEKKVKLYKDRQEIMVYEQKRVTVTSNEGQLKMITEEQPQNSQPKRRELEIVTMYADRSIEEVISILLSKLSRETKENLSLSK